MKGLPQPTTTIIDPEEQLYQPQYTTREVMSAYFDMAQRQTTTNSLYRSWLMDDAQSQGEKLSPEEINKIYNINAKEPMTQSAALVAQEAQQEVAKINNIIQNGPQTLWGGTLPGFGAAIVGGLLDPIDLPVGWAIGVGFKALAMGAKAAQLTPTLKEAVKVAKTVDLTRMQAFAADALGNITANGFTEAFNYKATKQEQMEIAADEVFRNVILTSLAFTGAIHGLGATFNKLAKLGDNVIERIAQSSELATQVNKHPSPIAQIAHDALIKDMEIDASLSTVVRNVFPDDADRILKNNDFNDIKAFVLKQDVDSVDNFKATLKESGYDQRKMYLFEEEVNPVLAPETIKEIETYLASDDLDPDGVKLADSPDASGEQITSLDADLARLKQYDSVQIDKNANADFGAFETNLKGRSDALKNEMEVLKSFAACVFGAGV